MMKRTGLMILMAVLFLALLSLNGAIAADLGFEMQEQEFENGLADFEMQEQALENGLADFDFEMQEQALENGLIDGTTKAANWQCGFYWWYTYYQGVRYDIIEVWSNEPWGWVHLNAYQGEIYPRSPYSVNGHLYQIVRVSDGWVWKYVFSTAYGNGLRTGDFSISFWGHLDHQEGNRLVGRCQIRVN